MRSVSKLVWITVAAFAMAACEEDSRCELTATCPPADAGPETPTSSSSDNPGPNDDPRPQAAPNGTSDDDQEAAPSKPSNSPQLGQLPTAPASAGTPASEAGREAIDSGIPEDGGASTGGSQPYDSGTSRGHHDAAQPTPEGACEEQPEDPANGEYDDCPQTPNGEVCNLVCGPNFVKDGDATCREGEWTTQSCVPSVALSVTVTDVADRTNRIDNAVIYVEGYFEPATNECDSSAFCEHSLDGSAAFGAFPSGEQRVVVVKDGFDTIPLPVSIHPEQTTHLQLAAVPQGFLEGNIAVVLAWQTTDDLDLVVNVPETGAGTCLHYNFREPPHGSLTEPPFAHLEYDNKSSTSHLETIRIASNQAGTGPYYNGTYNVLVIGTDTALGETHPLIWVLEPRASGEIDVTSFDFPDDATSGANAWHALDVRGNGSLSPVGTTELNLDVGTTRLPCIDPVQFRATAG